MALYKHFQEVKKAEKLPKEDKVGVCLTCKYWDVEEKRSESQTPKLALCVHSELKPYALIVSGSSGCNKWAEKSGISAEG